MPGKDRQSIRVGCVKYRNARPLIRGWTGPVEFDHPSALCRKLAADELDVALVSSYEFLRNPIYRIVDAVSIASDGPVYSVIVVYRGELAAVKEIMLDPASETSVALLRFLVHQRGLTAKLVEGETVPMSLADRRSAAQLLIGDQALRFRRDHPDCATWDLGAAWRETAGMPFVYAVWLVRPEVANAGEMADRLRRIRDENLMRIDSVIDEGAEFDREFLTRYYTEHLRFTFGDREKDGLQAFANACANLGLLPKRELAFDLV